MKVLNYILIILILGSCSSSEEDKHKIKEIPIVEFPSSWIKLTNLENAQVIYKPCDAANSNFWIKMKNANWILAHEEGHETSFDTIVKIEKLNTTYTLYIHPEYDQPPFTIEVVELNSKGISNWKWKRYNRDWESLYVVSSSSSEFETIEQPCRECWDDYICDESELNCDAYDLEKSLLKFKSFVEITIDEQDLESITDSLNTVHNYSLNVFLDTINNPDFFKKLSEIKTLRFLRLNIDIDRNPRDGIHHLNNIELLKIYGAKYYHLNQLSGLNNLKILHLEYAELKENTPYLFPELDIRFLSLSLCKVNNDSAFFTSLKCLEKLSISKSIIKGFNLEGNLNIKNINLNYLDPVEITSVPEKLLNLERISYNSEEVTLIGFEFEGFKESQNNNIKTFEKK